MSLFSSKTNYGDSLLLICKLVSPGVKKQHGKEGSLSLEKLRSSSALSMPRKGGSEVERWAGSLTLLGESNFRRKIATLNMFSRSSSPVNAVTNGIS